MTVDWRTLKDHHPVGAYLPVGQLDGDCSCGQGDWPCEAARKGLETYGFFRPQEREVSAAKFGGIAWVGDIAWLTAPPDATNAARLRKALVAVLGGLGYTVAEGAEQAS